MYDTEYISTYEGEEEPHINSLNAHEVSIRISIGIGCERVPGGYELVEPLRLEFGGEQSPEGSPRKHSITDGDGKMLMLKIANSYFPMNQFEIKAAGAPEPEHSCPRPHYHGKTDPVYGLVSAESEDVIDIIDPDPVGCGFGLYDSLERVNLPTTVRQREVLKK